MRIIHSADWQLHKDDKQRQEAFLYCADRYFELLDKQPKDFIQVFVGDMFENYNNITNDAVTILYDFFRKALTYSEVVLIPGNHDYDVKNPTKQNILDTIQHIIDNPSFYFFNEHRCYVLGDFIFANYCHYNKSERPVDLDRMITEKSGKKIIGLYHDPIQNAKTLNFDFANYATSLKIFEGCDAVLAGDIHLRQHFQFGKSFFVYPGSPYQLTHGENILGHGVVIWNDDLEFEYVDLETPYSKVSLSLTNSNIDNITIKNF